jgi:phosphoglycerate dehydrogenase-like enzyme
MMRGGYDRAACGCHSGMMKKEKVLIAGPYNEDAKEIMKEELSKDFELAFITRQEDFQEVLDADYVVLRTLKLPGDIISSMPKLKFIQRWGAGVDVIDIETAGERGIVVANTADANAPAVAELTLLLMLSVYRRILEINLAMHRGQWIKNSIDKKCFMINGKKVGIIGAGNIGTLVGKYVQALDAKVLYYDKRRLSPEKEAELGFEYASFEELLKSSDIITLHVPLDDTTKYMIDEEQFALMKKNAVLINCARGGVVNEKALIKALKEERILGAGLDCFETEPLPADSPILELPNLVLSCHVGGNTADVAFRLAHRCVENIRAFRTGQLEEKYIKNKKYLKK